MARTDNGDKLQAGEALRSASCSVIKSGSPAALHEPVAFHYLLSARSRTALLASCCEIATASLDLALDIPSPLQSQAPERAGPCSLMLDAFCANARPGSDALPIL